MRICDYCKDEIKRGEETPMQTVSDVYGELDVCKECNQAYTEIYASEKIGFMQEIHNRVQAKFDAWLEKKIANATN